MCFSPFSKKIDQLSNASWKQKYNSDYPDNYENGDDNIDYQKLYAYRKNNPDDYYDMHFHEKRSEFEKQILICDQMLQDNAPNEKIIEVCKKITGFCKSMRDIFEKKHKTNRLEKMHKKNQKDAQTYGYSCQFGQSLHVFCLCGEVNKDGLNNLFLPIIESLKARGFSIIFAKDLPETESEREFNNSEDYVAHVKTKITLYGSDDEKKSKLFNLLSQWYDIKRELCGYVDITLRNHKDDWSMITTILSVVNWYCESNIYTKTLLFFGGALAPLIGDFYYHYFVDSSHKPVEGKFTVPMPNKHARLFHDKSVDDAIKCLEKEVNRLQFELNSLRTSNRMLKVSNAINRGGYSWCTDMLLGGFSGLLKDLGMFSGNKELDLIPMSFLSHKTTEAVKTLVPHD